MYIVVENAGYVGERDVKYHTTLQLAYSWARNNYSDTELDTLHVAICREDKNGRTYEI
ncbi:hypothetical protein SAMN05444169_7628 [Bradyrhizobium erythrophlei]|uniref:Uncharacterized protein n=1 Tax=Bradyrhizobium erythrophlei TaxID=1437360 RepID=A0A1M5T9E1_9BRAD|nr:hypothetical protein SAMN05444169_7628 [Bradyrhizobium erythrophlei]